MAITERDPLGPSFKWRLKAGLDRVTPPLRITKPRYQSASMRAFPALRLAPALLAIATTGVLALSATAATGSPDPAVWTQRAASTIHSVSHIPETTKTPETSSPTGEQAPAPAPSSAAPSRRVAPASAPPTHEGGHEASPSPEPSDHHQESPHPEPTPSPHAGDGGSHDE